MKHKHITAALLNLTTPRDAVHVDYGEALQFAFAGDYNAAAAHLDAWIADVFPTADDKVTIRGGAAMRVLRALEDAAMSKWSDAHMADRANGMANTSEEDYEAACYPCNRDYS